MLLYLLVREMELPRLKVGVGHGVQLGKGLAGQRRHFFVHIRQRGMDARLMQVGPLFDTSALPTSVYTRAYRTGK